MQLDIFDHSRDVMLRNDVLAALELRQTEPARGCWRALRDAFPNDMSLAPLALLIDALADASHEPFVEHAALRQARGALEGAIGPAALGLYGDAAGRAWLAPMWRSMAERAAPLRFNADHADDHAAPLWLRLGDWSEAAHAVAGIESWQRIPAPLAWMAECIWRRDGLDAAWGRLAELAWLAPRRFDTLARQVADPLLNKLRKAFDAGFEGAGDSSDLAWLPAWALTYQPRLAQPLSHAQVSLHTPPEQAMRLMLELLGLERQGRQHDIVGHRKRLRDLDASLYASYMKTR